LIGVVGRCRQQDLPRVARRPYQPRDVTQQPLREIGAKRNS
jgi:hypothetical protein